MRIVLCYPVEERHVMQIAAAMPTAEVVDAGQEGIVQEILDADIYCGHAKAHPLPWDEVVQAGRLQWIQSSAAGMDHCLTPVVIESDIVVTSASGVLANQVAEQTLALLLGLSRGLPTFIDQWQRREFVRRPTRDLHNATVGIVGFGGNGRRLAEVLKVFNTRVIATDLFPIVKPDTVDQLWPADRLDDLLRESDYVILCAPLNEATRGMVDRRALGLMRADATLINVGRGKLIVEDDLVEALESGHLAGVGLDVTPDEPPKPDSRLWTAPRLLVTPHVGGQCATRIDDMTNFFCENLRRWQAGEPLLNLLTDKHLGFPIPTAERYGQ